MGISAELRGYLSAAKLLSEAEAARKTAAVAQKNFEFYDDIGIDKVIFGVSDKSVLKEFAAAQLGEIIKYDETYKTDYAKILYKYLLCDGSVNAVADECGLHRNTVNTKIKAVKEIFGIRLTGEKKAELLLAFRIKEIFDKMGGK